MVLINIISNPVTSIDDYLKLFEEFENTDIQNGILLDFEINITQKVKKINPILQLAKPNDANIITEMFLEVYKGTYPFKEMENVQAIREMIIDPNYEWILFKCDLNKIVGCAGVHFEFEKKRGYLFGFIIKKKYQGSFDSLKALLGYFLVIWKNYKNKILTWYSETRSAHNKGQWAQNLCGLKPIAFLPNKDLFFNRVESDFLHVTYDKTALRKYRYEVTPKIIPEVKKCFLYSNKIYHLNHVEYKDPNFRLDPIKLNKIKQKIIKNTERDIIGHKTITIFVKNSDSYLKFLYNPINQSIEKTKYEVSNLEELYIFIQELKELIKKLNVRYFQCLVSSYKPSHQKIFYNAGFMPRGYVPSWEYDKTKNIFKDHIVFNYNQGKINRNIQLTQETRRLLKALKLLPIINKELF